MLSQLKGKGKEKTLVEIEDDDDDSSSSSEEEISGSNMLLFKLSSYVSFIFDN